MAIRPDIMSWLRRRRELVARANADADMLLRELGQDAYAEARLMQNRAGTAEERRRWREVAIAIARKTGRRIGLDTATRMARDADFSKGGQRKAPESAPESRTADPIEELKRLIRDRGQKP